MAGAERRWWRVACTLSPGLIAVAVYAAVPTFDYINFDDPGYVAKNPFVLGGFSAEAVRWAAAEEHQGLRIPLTWLSFQLDAELFGASPRTFHRTNVLLHAANAVLLARATAALLGSLPAGLVAGALLAAHPLHVESVAWIAERKDVLFLFLLLLALNASIRAVRRPGGRSTPAAFGLFCLALLAKPTAAAFPLLLLLLDWWPLGRFRVSPRRVVVEKLPYLVAGLAALGATSMAHGGAAALAGAGGGTPLSRFGIMLSGVIGTASRAVWPSGLAVFYPVPAGGIAPWKAVGAFLSIGATLAAAYRWRRRVPGAWLAAVWFLAVLAPPAASLLWDSRATIGDRHAYLALVGCYLWVAAATAGPGSSRRTGLRAVLAFAVAALIPAARVQAGFWKDSETLWRRALEVTSETGLARTNLGVALSAAGKEEEAAHQFRRVLALEPGAPEATFNLARLLATSGDPANAVEATRLLEGLLAADPGHVMGRFLHGLLLAGAGDFPGAAAEFSQLLEKSPGWTDARYQLGLALARQGLLHAAARELQAVVDERPGWEEARFNLEAVGAALEPGPER